MNTKQVPSLWSGQLFHFIALTFLLAATWFLWGKIGKPSPFLFWLTISVPIIHQVFVWWTWRTELNSEAISKTIGLKTYLILFFIFLIGRLVVFLFLVGADYGSLEMNNALQIFLAATTLLPAMYTMYSVKKYFGFERAAGVDHFDEKYRHIPLVKKGMFKYSGNSMYVFGFMIFWGLAILFDSNAALLAAAFSHSYIWVHYYATEKPDMDYLYGSDD